MTSRKPTIDLTADLTALGLNVTAQNLDDFLARATTASWAPRALLEQLVADELAERHRRSLERRIQRSRIGRFKPIADFDWNWPKKIDRDSIERALTLDFIAEARNLILLGSNGVYSFHTTSLHG